jgi:hypothetical protein
LYRSCTPLTILGYIAGYRIDTLATLCFRLGVRHQDRHQVFGSGHLERIEQSMRDVYPDFGAELREFNGGPSMRT